MKLSIVIPAYNEEQNIQKCLDELRETVCEKHRIDCEIIVVNDNSTDETASIVRQYMGQHDCVRLVNRKPPGGFGRAIRSGLDHVTGDAVVIYMADLSDDPKDVVRYYKKLDEGFDCVFGSRFIKGAVVRDYPRVKLIVNRIVNRCVQWLFWSPYNDLTNAFKAYRTSVIRECGPFRASHFNITLEMSLAVLCRRYNVAQIPISWYGRTWGSSNLRLREMGRKYLCTVLMSFFQKMLISDDLMAERLATHTRDTDTLQSIQDRLNQLEVLLNSVDKHDVAVHSVTSDSSLGKPGSSTALSESEPVGVRQPHAEVTLQTSEASR